MSRRRRALFTLVQLALLGLASLLGLELVARGKFQPETLAVYMTGELEHDPLAGWRGRRGLSARVPHGRHPQPIQVDINADGFRDGSWDGKLARARKRAARKVLILGDSLVYGWANPVDGRLAEQLQARYAAAGQAAEVFDAGIPGYGPNHQLRLLPELLARLQPHEVVLVFCTNDYGDAALPYDYRYPFRVYQPFYDRNGALLFNARVPRRLSLALRPTALGGLRLWIAFDRLRNVWEDRGYARHGLPNARNAPVNRLNDLFGDPELRARFAYVEPTVLELYRRMALLCQTAGARFTFLPSVARVAPGRESLDESLRAPLERRGVRYLSCPPELERYQAFLPTLLDGHPNLIWAWILAGALHAELEGGSPALGFAGLPQADSLPMALELSDDGACSRALCQGWRAREAGGRRFDGVAGILLRNRAPGPWRLEITGSASPDARLRVQGLDQAEPCRVVLGAARATQACLLDTRTSAPVLFVTLTAEGGGPPLLERLRLLPAQLPSGPGRPRSGR